MKSIGLVMTMVLALFFDPSPSQAATAGHSASQVGNHRDEQSIIKYLQSALASTGFAVRLYFHGTCEVRGDASVQFPSIDVFPPSGGVNGLQAVRDIFRNDRSVKISADTPGVVRIIIGNVFRPVLDTRLSSLRLTTAARYNPDGPGGAIDLLESAAPVQAAMRELRVRQQPVFYIGLQEPAKIKLSHLPSSMKNVTVDQALDAIAKTFPGVVVYGECPHPDGSHTIDIKFDWFPAR